MRPVLVRLWSLRRALSLYALLLIFGLFAGDYLMELAVPEMRPMNEPLIHRIVMGSLFVFILAAAIPFVPGAEIGFALLLLFGGQAAPIVYAGMVSALLLSYCVARFVPLRTVSLLFRWLGLGKLAGSVDQLAETPLERRAALVSDNLSGRFSKSIVKNRYVLLMVLLNLPGNTAVGGGGGLAFAAGLSGLYRFWPYVFSVLIAVAPFPLFFLILGN